MGDAEGLAVSEACLCNIEHFQGSPEGFPGLRTEQNRVRDEQKEDERNTFHSEINSGSGITDGRARR